MLQVKSKFKQIGKTLYLRIPVEMARDSEFPFKAEQQVELRMGRAFAGLSGYMGGSPMLQVTGL